METNRTLTPIFAATVKKTVILSNDGNHCMSVFIWFIKNDSLNWLMEMIQTLMPFFLLMCKSEMLLKYYCCKTSLYRKNSL